MAERNELLYKPLEYRARMNAQIMQLHDLQSLRGVSYDQAKATNSSPGDPTYKTCERLERLEDDIEQSFLDYANSSNDLLIRAKKFDRQTFDIIQHRLIHGHNMDWISKRMDISRSTVYRKYRAFTDSIEAL